MKIGPPGTNRVGDEENKTLVGVSCAGEPKHPGQGGVTHPDQAWLDVPAGNEASWVDDKRV